MWVVVLICNQSHRSMMELLLLLMALLISSKKTSRANLIKERDFMKRM